MSIKFKLYPEKAVQVAAAFLKQSGAVINSTSLLKLIYIADRKSFNDFGTSLTTDRYVSMQMGPVASVIYDLIEHDEHHSDSEALKIWSEHISSRDLNYDVRLIKDPGDGELCEDEDEIIQDVYAKFGHLTWDKLVDYVHKFPEWQDPKNDPLHRKSIPLSIEDILRALNKPDREIQAIQADAAREYYLDSVLQNAYQYI